MTDEYLEIFEKSNEKILGTDIILFLLSIGQIRNKIVFQKQVFLAWKEVFYKETADLGYYPYMYGPFSQIITDAAKYLECDGLIKTITRKNEGSIFQITDYGLKKIHERINNLGINLSELKNKKKDWDEWDKEGIMRYTYRMYPEYTTETILDKFKWSSQ